MWFSKLLISTYIFRFLLFVFDKQGPGGVWCDVDVVEFSYYGAPAPTPKEQLYDELVDGLRGSDPIIGSGSQVLFLRFSYIILNS